MALPASGRPRRCVDEDDQRAQILTRQRLPDPAATFRRSAARRCSPWPPVPAPKRWSSESWATRLGCYPTGSGSIEATAPRATYTVILTDKAAMGSGAICASLEINPVVPSGRRPTVSLRFEVGKIDYGPAA
jgi:hypothetical protein